MTEAGKDTSLGHGPTGSNASFRGWLMVAVCFGTQFMVSGCIFYAFSVCLIDLADEFSGGERAPVMLLQVAGGVATALRRTPAKRVLFLGCDMPFLTAELTQRVLAVEAEAVFASVKGTVGFPFALSPGVLPKVEAQLAAGWRSLQRLAVRLRARRIRVLAAEVPQLQNLNTPADLAEAIKTAACLGWRF